MKLVKYSFITILILYALAYRYIRPLVPRESSLQKTVELIIARFEMFNSTNDSKLKKLTITIPQSSFRSLEIDRINALRNKFMIKEFKNYVPAKIEYGNEVFDSKIRLRGTNKNHWEDKIYWSYKVKLLNGKINQLRKFGLMYPVKRCGSYEWYFHQVMRHAGNNYLNYNFINLSINNMNIGPYAIEEAFTNKLYCGATGVLFKININTYRDTVNLRNRSKLIKKYPGLLAQTTKKTYQSLPIVAYGKYNISDFEYAKKIFNDFRNEKKSTSEVFDVDKLAKSLALYTLLGCQHPMYIHNLKLYFNSETKLIEVIPYDFEQWELLDYKGNYNHFLPWSNTIHMLHHYPYMFKDSVFKHKYIKTQLAVAQVSFIDSIINLIEPDHNKIIAEVKNVEGNDCSFEYSPKEIIIKNAAFIRKNLPNDIKNNTAFKY